MRNISVYFVETSATIWRSVRPWILAARLKTLPAAICPVIFAAVVSICEGMSKWLLLSIISLCAVLIQVICNYANDLYDFLKGADTAARIGPQRAVQSGLISPKAIRNALKLLVVCVILSGLLLVKEGGLPILAIGITSILAAFAYTSGPFPFAYIGLGELFVLIFFGPVPVYGTLLILIGRVIPSALIIGVGIAALASALIVVNNVRDRAQDKKASKNTIAVRIGEPWCRYEYGFLLSVAALAPVIALNYGAPVGVLAGSLCIFFWGFEATKTLICANDGTCFASVLAKTVRILVFYTIAASGGWFLSAIV